MTPPGSPEDLDLAAAEYVLGTLDRGERDLFAGRLRDDEQARRAVAGWERRFAGLAAAIPPMAPPAGVWPAIERALPPASARPADLRVIPGGRGTSSAGVVTSARIETSRNRWRAAALVLGSLAAVLVAFIAVDAARRATSVPAPMEASYVAAVNRGGDKPALLVRVDLATRKIYVVPVAAEAPPDRSLELWYIGDNKPPRSMGLVDKTEATLPMPAGAQPVGATFAVSVEPHGGSKTGGPTGPVVYSGQLVKE